jgi:hypothetical protein
MNRVIRLFAVGALATILYVGAGATSAWAQDESPAPGAGSGRPWDGYFATGALAFLALFVVGKSARR